MPRAYGIVLQELRCAIQESFQQLVQFASQSDQGGHLKRKVRKN